MLINLFLNDKHFKEMIRNKFFKQSEEPKLFNSKNEFQIEMQNIMFYNFLFEWIPCSAGLAVL